MRHAIARIELLSSNNGGRQGPLPEANFGCPVFFENVPALAEHGYDCRLDLVKLGGKVSPGDTLSEVGMSFLSWDELRPHLRPGVRFRLWEGKVIGHGEIVSL